jgi:predicted kinase
MATLTLIRGIPGSGKSTLARQLLQSYLRNRELAKHLEADMYFVDGDGNYVYDKSKIQDAHRWCQQQTLVHLAYNFDVIVSNTFVEKRHMQPYFEMAEKWKYQVRVILCQNEYGSIHNVPQESMEKMKKNFEY